MKTAIIIPTGFDGGGSTTLGYQFHKIGLDVYFNNVVAHNQYRSQLDVNLYNSTEELIEILKDYEKVIFSLLAVRGKDLGDSINILSDIKIALPNLKICYLNCGRKIGMLEDIIKDSPINFDWIYSISPADTICNNSSYLDINAYTFRDEFISVEKSPIIFTAGRVESVKGIIRYFNSFTDSFKNDDYFYIHEGANFSFNKNGSVSTPLQMLTLKNNPNVVFKNYGDSANIDKLNVYPSYNIDDIEKRWSTYYAGVCCILGSKSTQVSSLFDDSISCKDPKETALLRRQPQWSGLEYTNIEMIDVGVPVLFSKMYAQQVLGFDYEPLIYDRFEQIPKKVKELESCYTDAIKYQRDFFIQKQVKINQNIIKNFTENL